ncbi:putative metallophosphoesterase YhaO [Heyndrickxia sporothermodurans]|nr:putative metallophosphoesterase YhaO [Heyndrickxia sporothermodurans]
MSSIQFIHTADLHLDSPFVGLNYLPKTIFKRIQESTFTSLIKLIDAAISMKVDFVLICGDLYDGEDRSIKAQARLRKQMERLQEAGIEVFMLHGNHDHLSGNWTTIEMPSNVHIFSPKVEMKSFISKHGDKVHIYGFSYPERHVMEKKINEYQRIEGADYHIGMLHGHCEGNSAVHQPYAPFSIQDLLGKHMDYWALGHIHKQQVLHNDDPYIVYPGNIQGRHRKEDGTKGCFAVTLTDQKTFLKPIETADIIWKDAKLNAKSVKSFSDLYLLCKKKIESLRLTAQGVFLNLAIEDAAGLERSAFEKIRNGELIEALQDGEEYEDSFVWTFHVDIAAESRFIEMDDAFKKELDETKNELAQPEVFEKAIGDLFGHVYFRRFLENLSEEEKKDLLSDAEQMVSKYFHSNL